MGLKEELENLVRYWRVRQSDDRTDKLQELFDSTRIDCAAELEDIIIKYYYQDKE